MLGKILVRFVRPYWPFLLLVIVFQAAQSPVGHRQTIVDDGGLWIE